MISYKISKYVIVTDIVYFAIICLFAFDCRTFFAGILPLNIVTSIVFFTLLIGLFMTFSDFHKNKISVFRYNYVDFFMLSFLLLYGLKMGVNIFIQQIEQTNFNNRITFIPYYILLCVFPYLLCRNIDWRKANLHRLLWICYFVFLLGLLLSFQSAISLLSMGDSAYEGRFQANDFLDTIGYGHMALTFVFICVSLWNASKMKIRYILALSILFGLFSMGMANSRSPFVALLFILGVISFVKMDIRKIIIIIFLIAIVIFNLEIIDSFFKEFFKSQFIERLMTIFEFNMDSSSGRDGLYKSGIHMFLNNPILGDAIVLTEGSGKGLYVHNSIIEAFMALGLLGGGGYIIMNIIAFKYALSTLKDKECCFFSFLFMQYFIYLQFSRSMLLLPLYWAAIGCIAAYKNIKT